MKYMLIDAVDALRLALKLCSNDAERRYLAQRIEAFCPRSCSSRLLEGCICTRLREMNYQGSVDGPGSGIVSWSDDNSARLVRTFQEC